MNAGEVTTRFGGDIRPLQQSISGANAALSGFAQGAASQLAKVFSGAAIGLFIRGVIDVNGRLQDLADQTKFNASTLSGLRGTLENAGVSVDTFARSIQIAQRTLGQTGEESDKAAVAFRAMGLDIKQLKDLAPEEFFQKTVKGIADFADVNSRGALSTATLGRGGIQLAGVIDVLAKDFDKLKRSGLNNETVAALDDLGDSFGRLWISIQNAAAPAILGTFNSLQQVLGALDDTMRALFPSTKNLSNEFFTMAETTARLTTGLLLAYEGLLRVARIAPLAMESLSFGSLDFNSAAWTKAIDDIEKRLETIKNIARPDLGPDAGGIGLPPPGISGKRFNPPDTKAADAIKSVTESLRKQLIGLEAEEIAFKQGEAAALRFKLTQDALAETGLKKLTPAMTGLIDKIIAASEAMDTLRKKEEVFAASAAHLVSTFESGEKNVADFAALMDQIKFEGMSEGEQKLTLVNKQFDDMRRNLDAIQDGLLAAGNMTPAMADSFSEALERINRGRSIALSKSGGELGLTDEVINRTTQALRSAELQSKIFGESFDIAATKIDIFKSALKAMGADLDLSNEQFKQYADSLKMLEEGQKAADTAEQLVRGGMEGIANSIKGVAMGTQTLGEAFTNMGIAAASAIGKVIFELMVLEPLIKGMRASMTGQSSSGGGIFGMLGGLIGGFLGGMGGGGGGGLHVFDELDGRAMGGPVSAGRLYRVNEKGGSEFFRPNQSGNVIPMGGGSGIGPGQARSGGDVHIGTMDFRGAAPGVSDEVRRAIATAKTEAVQLSIPANQDNRRRSRNTEKIYR